MTLPHDEWTELLHLYRAANEDERAVMMMVARQVMGKGRREYGPLVLSDKEKRNFAAEGLAEIADAIAYLAVALRQVAIKRAKGGV